MDLTQNKPSATTDDLSNDLSILNLVPKNHKLYHLFNFIGKNYSNLENVSQALKTIFDIDKGLKAFSDKKLSLKNIFTFLRYMTPASIYTTDMFFKIKKYIDSIKKGDLSEYDKKLTKIKNLLEIKSFKDIIKLDTHYLNDELIYWLLQSPQTSDYKIIGYYDINTFEKLEKIPTESEMRVFILIQWNKNKILLYISTKVLGEFTYLDETIYYVDNNVSQSLIIELERLIIKDFINLLNINENIIELNGGITTRKRSIIEENINQFDMKPFMKEIRKILKNNRKKGIAFIGKQGTGKSIIIKKLEELMIDIIIIKIGSDMFRSPTIIKNTFKLIKAIQPAIIVIEDADSFGFQEKNEKVAQFINEIDDSNNDLNVFIIISINDPSRIHKTIIDRPGRFDEIIEIKPPQSYKEIYEVIKSKFHKLRHYYKGFENLEFPELREINCNLLDICLKYQFTQAELTCGIIEKLFLNIDNPNNINFNNEFEKAINSLKKSKETLKNYSFNEKIYQPEESTPVPLAVGQTKNFSGG